MISKGPAAWRIFLFNIFWPCSPVNEWFYLAGTFDEGFVKKIPDAVYGQCRQHYPHAFWYWPLSYFSYSLRPQTGADVSPENSISSHCKPWEVLSLWFSNYYEEGKVDYEKFPALKLAEGLDFTLEHGDTLFMPASYWHHMEYLDSGLPWAFVPCSHLSAVS